MFTLKPSLSRTTERSALQVAFLLISSLALTIDTLAATSAKSDDSIKITESAFEKPSPKADKLFTRQYGEERSLKTESRMSVSMKFMAPFSENWPVASGDFDNDGWTDLVFGTDAGLFLYRNNEGNNFERIALDLPGKKNMVMNTAFIDINNDGYIDLFYSLYRKGNHIMINNGGKLSADNQVSLPDMGSTIWNATAFGDLDLDGDIDIVAGNWAAGPYTRQPGEMSRNAILWNKGDSFEPEQLPGIPGETLSILISDINQDGHPDIMITNDFQVPEYYYYGQGEGRFRATKRSDNIFPVTAFSTMSIDSGDIDNDLDFEIYATQASGFTSTNPTNRASMLPLQPIEKKCEEYADDSWKRRCLKRLDYHTRIFDAWQKRNPRTCTGIDDPREKKHCLAYYLLEKSTRFDRNPSLCEQFNEGWKTLSYICNLSHQPSARITKEQVSETLKQVLGRNIFYRLKDDGSYEEIGEQIDVDITGWSWTARFADLDNDEWQDIYVVNGRFPSQKRATKVFFRNLEGKTFVNDTRQAGLENYSAISAYTYIDYDNDGDLDIVAVSFDGPVWFYTNNEQDNHRIMFTLEDHKGNRPGIGSRIIIHYGEDSNKHQIREIKASGGFVSYDAPFAHFGLGKHDRVSRIEVIWSTGERTVHDGLSTDADVSNAGFRAGHRYHIVRQ